MPTLPDLPGGVEWRPASVEDAAGLAAHTRLVHETERLSFLPNADFFEWLLTQPGIDPADDVRVGLSGDEIVADCGTWLHTAEGGSRCIVWVETTPGHEELRDGMVAWVTARARARLDGDPRPAVIRASVEEHRSGQRNTFERAGYEVGRTFAEMARPLDDLPELRAIGGDLTVVPWSNDLAEGTRLASNESFADHWGTLPMTPEEWHGFTSGAPTFRADLSFVALDGERVVSFCLAEVDEDDNAERDTDDLYIHRVGTVASHRGRGIASHLIVRSMQAAVATGELDRAALEVDEMSHTDATAVYERLGFSTYARSMSYVIEEPEQS